MDSLARICMQIHLHARYKVEEIVSWELVYLYQFHADMLKELVPSQTHGSQPPAQNDSQPSVTERRLGNQLIRTTNVNIFDKLKGMESKKT